MRINLNDDEPTYVMGLCNLDDEDYRRELTKKLQPILINGLKEKNIPFAKAIREIDGGKLEKELKHLKRAKNPLLSKEHILIIGKWFKELPKA